MILEQLLTVMRAGKELGNLRPAPNNLHLFIGAVILSRRIEVVFTLILEVSQIGKDLLQSPGLETVSCDDNQIYLMISENSLQLPLVLLMVL